MLRRVVAVLIGGVLAGLIMLAVGWVFDQLEAAFPSIGAEYENKAAFREWPGWTQCYMITHPLWYGFAFTLGFVIVDRGRIPVSRARAAGRGILYGCLVFLIGSLPIFGLVYASFQVSITLMVVSWAARNLAQYLLAGLGLGLLAKTH